LLSPSATILTAANAPFGAIVAFSGKKTVDGIEEYTEDLLNGFPSKDIPEAKLRTEDYRLLVVANKFLTGFDEPLLHAHVHGQEAARGA
jgi:type I restriction enzyme R subunit